MPKIAGKDGPEDQVGAVELAVVAEDNRETFPTDLDDRRATASSGEQKMPGAATAIPAPWRGSKYF